MKLSFILTIGILLFILNMQGCREGVIVENDIEFTFWQCDTLTKYNPAKDLWRCWVKCIDTNGYEYSKDIDCK